MIYRERLELAVQSWACSEVGAFDGNGVCLVANNNQLFGRVAALQEVP